MAINPRWKSGRRRKYQQRFRAIEAPCGICGGKYGRIHYEEPSDPKHPFSFVIDEIIPISKWESAGYSSPEAAADDVNNIQAAHYICNQMKGNKVGYSLRQEVSKKYKRNISDGDW